MFSVESASDELIRPHRSRHEKENRHADDEDNGAQNDFISLQGSFTQRRGLAIAAPINELRDQIRTRKPHNQGDEKTYQRSDNEQSKSPLGM
jgi:hypothetical protein